MSARLLASAGVLALAASLSSCGFDYATDRVYDVAAGTTDRDASVDVLNAVIVSAQEGSGTLITSFSNNDQQDSATVTGIAGGDEGGDLQVKDFQPVEIEPGALVNLATADSAIVVKSADMKAGDVETLSFTFEDGTAQDVDVPVVPACGEWAGLDQSSTGGAEAGAVDECDFPESEYYPETGIPSNE